MNSSYKYVYAGAWDFTGSTIGIRSYSMNEEKKLEDRGIYGDKGGHSIMTFAGKYLVAVNELNKGGRVVSYLRGEDESLTETAVLSVDFPKLSYVVADPSGEYVYVSSMGNGSVNMIRVDEDGSLTLTCQARLTGHSVSPRQSVAKVHSVMISADGKYLAAANLGADEIDLFEVDKEEGKLSLLSTAAVDFGQSPRHMAFSPDSRYLYVLTETGCRLYVYLLRGGRLTLLAAYNNMDPEGTFDSQPADIVITRDGKYIYTTNRGQNNIAVWKVNEKNGLLDNLGYFNCGGEGPRGICLSPDETELLSANHEDNSLTRIARNTENGELGEILDKVEVINAGCVRVI